MISLYLKTYTKRALIAFCYILALRPIHTHATTANKWENMLLKDLEFIEETLKLQSAPGRNKEDIAFKRWLQEGVEKTKSYATKQVNSEKAYRELLNYYVLGFQNEHLDIYFFDETLQQYHFLGFFLEQRGEHYLIGYVEENMPQRMLYKQVIAIDGKEIKAYIRDIATHNFAIGDEIELKRWVPYMLIDRESPLIKRPRSITIINEKKELEQLTLKWQPLQEKHHPIIRNLSFGPKPKMQYSPFCGGMWITIPTFNPNEEEKTLFEEILKSLQNYRDMPFIIFDLRGNSGGNAVWQRPILRNLYGDSFIKSLGGKHIYNAPWRQKQILEDNRDIIREWDILEEERENLFSNEDIVEKFPKVFLLTDGRCGSTCWMFVRDMLQLPNVIQIGDSTASQSLYSNSRWVTLPSGKGKIYVPTMQRMHPLDNIDKPFHPTYTFQGDWHNEEELKQWVISILEKLNWLAP